MEAPRENPILPAMLAVAVMALIVVVSIAVYVAFSATSL